MTRGEWIRQATDDEISEMLCNITECTNCPAEELCVGGQDGLLKWLKEEHEDG